MLTVDRCNQLLDDLSRAAVGDRARLLHEAAAAQEPRELLGELIEHAARLTAQDAARAIEVTSLVVNLADRLGSQLDRARARRARARALSYTGRFGEALWACDEGIRLAEEAGSSIEAGRARLASMHALGELGRLDEAITAGEAAREAFIAAGEPALAAKADINLGVVHQRRDDPSRAVACFERARPVLAGDSLVLGHLENNRGEALLGLNDFHGAQKAYQAALQAFQASNASLTAAIAEGNLAELAARQGRLQESLVYFEAARRHLECDAAPGHLARLLAERAEAINVLGLPQDALHEYERALPDLDRCGLALEAARARSGMGQALLRLNRPTEAETALAAAAKAFDDLGHATARAKVDLIRAELALSHHRASEARGIVMGALAALHDRPAEMVLARHLLGRIAMALGRLAEADADFASALAIADDLDLAPLRADVLISRGSLYRRRGRTADAIADFTAAIAQVERLRGSLQAERFRTAILGNRAAVYELLVQTLLDCEDQTAVRRAFAVAEQAKSRSLLERMQHAIETERNGRANDPATQDLFTRLSQLRSELNGLYSRWGDDSHAVATNIAARDQWRAAVQWREQELDQLEARLATTRGVGTFYSQTAKVDDLAGMLMRDHALIEYFIVDQEILAFVVVDGQIRCARNLARAADIELKLQRLNFQMNRALRPGALADGRDQRLTRDANSELQAIENLVFAPLRPLLEGVKRLTIVPHGPLHAMPFHALWNGSEYLIQQFEVNYIPSASLLVHLIRTEAHAASQGRPSVVSIGVSDEIAPRIGEEAEAVATLLDFGATEILLNQCATAAAVAAALPQADIAHVACHGRFATDSPLSSGVKLYDRWLTVRDICDMHLRARLVTLSGCETGVNLVSRGDELMGLLRGLLAAGAQSILVSYWRVDDEVTREFMTDFYTLLRKNSAAQTRISYILAQAQRCMMSRHEHPALWAPFVLVGQS